jgi:folylpolyglutamate synthase/dihydropteroate synthase
MKNRPLTQEELDAIREDIARQKEKKNRAAATWFEVLLAALFMLAWAWGRRFR